MAMMIEEIVRVTITGVIKPINRPPDLVWKSSDDGTVFVKLAKGRSEINRLLGQPILQRSKDKRKLQFTTIIETLAELRNNAVKEMLVTLKAKEDKLDFGTDDPLFDERRQSKKTSRRTPTV